MLMVLPLTASASQWLCVAEKATGFTYNKYNEDWEQVNFKAEDKYIIKPGEKPPMIVVTLIGDEYPMIYCSEGYNEGGNLVCDGGLSKFEFNSRNNTYMKLYTVGLFAPEGNDIAIQLGKCSPL